MNSAIHPQVMLKKNLIGFIVAMALGIGSLIIYNIYHSSDARARKQQSSNGNSIQTLATQADANWFQGSNEKDQKNPKRFQQTNTLRKHSFGSPVSPNVKISMDGNEEIKKVMSAPIASNQLIASNGLKRNSGPLADDQSKELFGSNRENQTEENDYLGSSLQNPRSSYELQAGNILSGILLTGINSDLPGQIIGQMSHNVFDSISGKYLLIPQGAKLLGTYDAQIAYGQERVMVVWNRIIFPNGQSINLQGMQGVDRSGYTGFNDQVNNHYSKMFGAVLLMSVLSAGAQLSQPQNNHSPFDNPTLGQTLAQSVGTNISNTATLMTNKNIDIKPTLQIRPGYLFNIIVTKDIVFPAPYTS